MKYKAGDKVRTIPWDKIKDDTTVLSSIKNNVKEYCGREATITYVSAVSYKIDIDNGAHYWTDKFFEDESSTCKEFCDEWVEMNSTDECRFRDITNDMVNTFIKKNHDYGNSFEEACDEEGIVAARIPIRNKWNRFKTLSRGGEAMVEGESIIDTLKDMANYCILTIMWLDKQKENNNLNK